MNEMLNETCSWLRRNYAAIIEPRYNLWKRCFFGNSCHIMNNNNNNRMENESADTSKNLIEHAELQMHYSNL